MLFPVMDGDSLQNMYKIYPVAPGHILWGYCQSLRYYVNSQSSELLHLVLLFMHAVLAALRSGYFSFLG